MYERVTSVTGPCYERDRPCYEHHAPVMSVTPLLHMWLCKIACVQCLSSYGFLSNKCISYCQIKLLKNRKDFCVKLEHKHYTIKSWPSLTNIVVKLNHCHSSSNFDMGTSHWADGVHVHNQHMIFHSLRKTFDNHTPVEIGEV